MPPTAAPPLISMEAILCIVVLWLAAASMLSSASAAESTSEQEEAVPSPIISSSTTTTTTAAASAPLRLFRGLPVMQFRINDTNVSGIADTGSDLIWTNNSQVLNALPSDQSPRCDEFPFSSTCNELCMFKRSYSGNEDVRGVMGQAKLTFGSESGKPYTTTDPLDLGSALNKQDCKNSYNRGGVVGLGRGGLSLVTQLRLTSFSYCLPDLPNETGYIRFNETAEAVSSFEGTKLKLELKERGDSKYYVGLKKVLVCKKAKNKDGRCDDDEPQPKDDDLQEKDSSSCGGDMFIDSGATFTLLPEKAFEDVKKLISDKEPETKVDDLACFQGKDPPGIDSTVTLKFCSQGQEQDMEIPANLFFTKKPGHNLCLAFKKQQEGKTSVLGAYQQRGMRMLFDIKDNTLTFARTKSDCGQSNQHATM